MARDIIDSQEIGSRNELIEWFEKGSKASGTEKVGTEHEKILFSKVDLQPVAYDGPAGIGAILQALAAKTQWQPIEDEGAIIGLFDTQSGAAVSIEPGGQFELSGAPMSDIHATVRELDRHFADMAQILDRLKLGALGMGMSPLWTLKQTPIMPKQRYNIMAGYMPQVGTRGLDMMFRTSTVQANLDYTSEADMVRKLRVTLALQPLFTALFANSPFTDGKPNGLLSARSEIWRDTDNQRAGLLPFVFEPGMGFERYVDYALDVPMYFIKRGDIYHNVAGKRFRDLLAGRLPGHEGEKALVSDWANHLGTIFPEVRLKRYLEMRGADMGSRDMVVSFPALCVGLLYDGQALDALEVMTGEWSFAQLQALRDAVPRLGLAALIHGRSLRDIGIEVLKLAEAGLARRARLDAQGRNETHHLAPLHKIIASGRTQAQIWLDHWHSDWQQSIKPLFEAAQL